MNRPSPLRFPLLALGLVILLGFTHLIRRASLAEPLWIDERHTLWTVEANYRELVTRAAWGNQPPGYFAILKAVVPLPTASSTAETIGELRNASGNTRATAPGPLALDSAPPTPAATAATVAALEPQDPWAEPLRTPSHFAGLLLILCVSLLVFRLRQSVSAALAAAAILAFDPTSIAFAVEARPYAFVMLAAPLQIFLLGRRLGLLASPAQVNSLSRAGEGIVSTPSTISLSRWRWPTILLSIALPWLHYTTVLVLASELLAIVLLLPWLQRRHRSNRACTPAPHLAMLSAEALVVLLGIMPLAWSMSHVAAHRGQWSAFVTGSAEQWQPMLNLAIVALLLPAAAWVVDRRPGPRPLTASLPATAASSSAALNIALIAIPLAAVWGLAALATYVLGTPLIIDRYLVATWPWAAWLAGMILSQLRCDWLRPTAAAIVSIAAIGNPDLQHWYDTGSLPTYRYENWYAVTVRIEQFDDNWPVYSYPSLIEDGRLASSPDPAAIDYLKFPLVGLAHPERIIPCASVPQPLWNSDTSAQIQAAGGAHFIVRDDPRDPQRLRWVAAQLASSLEDSPTPYIVDTLNFGAVFLMTVRPTRVPTPTRGQTPGSDPVYGA